MSDTVMEDPETIREFLVESHENLGHLDLDLVELEKRPKDAALLSSAFRTIHTIKGASGFLAFSKLEQLTHEAETLLSQLRDGERDLSPQLVSLILETADATRKLLASIEETGHEGNISFEELIERLRGAAQLHSMEGCDTSVSFATPKSAESDPPGESAVECGPSAPKMLSGPSAEAQKQQDEFCSTSSPAVDANIRVGVGLLDKLMDLVGELVLTRNQILQFNSEREDAVLSATSQRLNLITSELQEGVMKTRMQPIGVVWHNLPRVVRDMAVTLGKQIQIRMDGADTELDRTIIEAIKDPLVHLVRNSCDHGIEPPAVRIAMGKPASGTMTLRAYHEGGQVNIEVSDDGRGIDVVGVSAKAVERGLLRPEQLNRLTDREILSLIFQPGFSTAATVTNISGRGVGMDVVKSQIEKIGGAVDILTRAGNGTTIKIRIPLTLAIIPGLIITSGGEQFVIPQVSLLELIRLDADSSGKHIEHIHGTPVYRRRGTLLPIAYLNDILGLEQKREQEAVNIVVLQSEGQQFGLVVDSISDTQEIVVKPLCKQLKGITLYAGATIMGDGHVALILDVLGVGQRSGVFGHRTEQSHSLQQDHRSEAREKQRLLLFRAGSFDRIAMPLIFVDRLEEFPRAAIERAADGQVIQYRNQILPLIPLASTLHPDHPAETDSDPVHVVVIRQGDLMVGMVVDEILDITEEAIEIRRASTRSGLLGSAVIGKRVADFLDLEAFLDTASRGLGRAGPSSDAMTVLLVDPTPFSRHLAKASLEIAGYLTLETGTAAEALSALEHNRVHVIGLRLDHPTGSIRAIVEAIRSRTEWSDIPIAVLAQSREAIVAEGLDPDQIMWVTSASEMRVILDQMDRTRVTPKEMVTV